MPNDVRKALQGVVKNTLPAEMDNADFVCGIIGESPSKSARSPIVWNAAFRALGWNALFVPFDLDAASLPTFAKVVRELPSLRGFAVTMPYKVDALPLLDDLDPDAAAIGAVNTVANDGGHLVGYNTDASGFLSSLTRTLPGRSAPFYPDLAGRRILVIGAGGAGRAIAFTLARAVGRSGEIILSNRNAGTGTALAQAVAKVHGNARFVEEGDIADAAAGADLIVNASTRGQSGIRRAGDGFTVLEPYSALAPANPAVLPADADERAFLARWWSASRADVLTNLAVAADVLARVPPSTAVVDAVFSPAETPLLRDARLSGHRTQNGRPMNLCQAADAFVERVLPGELKARRIDARTAYGWVFEAMASAP